MRQTRLNEMNKYIMEKSAVSYEEMCQKFGISINTARRDIDTLAAEGSIVKTYGGAAVNKNTGLVSYNERHISNISDKTMIAKEAAKLLEDGDIVFFDSGTTVPIVLEHVGDMHLTVITASFDVLVKGFERRNIDIYSMPGRLNRETNSFQEIGISKHLMSFNINKAFMSASGYSINGGVTTSAPWEYQIKKAVLSKEAEKYLLIDKSKFDRTQMFKYADANDFDYIITSAKPEDKYLDFFGENNIDLIISD